MTRQPVTATHNPTLSRRAKKSNDNSLAKVAEEFETTEFTPEELANIKRSRRRSPRLGESKAEVYAFRIPPNYRERIKQRADSDAKSQSQVIRDALDAYL